MAENRLREYFNQSAAVMTADAPTDGFVPCPCSMFAAFGVAHPSFVAEVYRLAREMTAEQLRKPARVFPPAFSLN